MRKVVLSFCWSIVIATSTDKLRIKCKNETVTEKIVYTFPNFVEGAVHEYAPLEYLPNKESVYGGNLKQDIDIAANGKCYQLVLRFRFNFQ